MENNIIEVKKLTENDEIIRLDDIMKKLKIGDNVIVQIMNNNDRKEFPGDGCVFHIDAITFLKQRNTYAMDMTSVQNIMGKKITFSCITNTLHARNYLISNF